MAVIEILNNSQQEGIGLSGRLHLTFHKTIEY